MSGIPGPEAKQSTVDTKHTRSRARPTGRLGMRCGEIRPVRSLLLNYLRPVIFKASNMIYGSNKQPSYEIVSYYSNKITNNWIQQQAPNFRQKVLATW